MSRRGWIVLFLVASLVFYLAWRELRPPPGIEAMGDDDIAPTVSLYASIISGVAGLVSIVREIVSMFREK